MSKNPFLSGPKPDADKVFAEFEKFAAKHAKKLDAEAKKGLKEADRFKPEKDATYKEDPKPEPFHGQAFLLLESFDGDQGARPAAPPSPHSPCLSVTDDQGRIPNGVSMGAKLDLKCTVKNLGDLDVHNATVEFFLGDARFHPDEQPFRLVVDEVFQIAGRGLVAVGTVASGSVQAGQQVVVRHGNQEVQSTISGIQQGTAEAGQTVGLLLRGLRREQVPRGSVITRQDQAQQEPTIATVSEVSFLGSVQILVEAFGENQALWTEQLTQILPSGFHKAVIYARVYAHAPNEQLPDDFDRLDPATERLVGWFPLG